MKPTKWTSIRNSFDPFDPIPPDKLDEWFVERPDSRIEFLLTQLSPNELPKRRILVGQPASGKSTELTKLAAELKRSYDSLVVQFDLTDNTHIEGTNSVEILFLIGAAIFKVAHAEMPEDLRPSRKLLEEMHKILEAIARTEPDNTEFTIDLEKVLKGLVVVGSYAYAGPAGAAIAMNAASYVEKLNPFRLPSGTTLSLVRQPKIVPKVESLTAAVNALIQDIHSKTGRRLVVIVDGLDKLRDHDVISFNFLEKKFLAGPACNIVYTGPLDLYYSPHFGAVRGMFQVIPFTHVKLYDPNNRSRAIEAGYEFMRNVVRRRIESLKLKSEEVVAPDALDLLIRGSGGVMRDFVRLFQSATLYADIAGRDRVENEDAVDSLNELRRQLKAQLTPDFEEILNQVKTTRNRIADEKCDLLLRNDIVLGYFNKEVWYDVHAALSNEPW